MILNLSICTCAVGLSSLFFTSMSMALAPEAIPLKKGEKIIFLGDSITQGGGGPKGYVTLVTKALAEKHKDLGITTVNAGISGNKVPDLQRRLQKDVIDKKPTIVIIYHWLLRR